MLACACPSQSVNYCVCSPTRSRATSSALATHLACIHENSYVLCRLLPLTFQISTIPTDAHPTGYIVSNADDLLELFDSDAGLLVIGDGCKLLGQYVASLTDPC